MKWRIKMNNLLPPANPIDALGEAYELLLESALDKAHQSGVFLHHMIEKSRDDITALNKFSHDEINQLEAYLKRDLIDAARYLNKTGNDLKFWLGFDVALIKRELWEQFSHAANHTAKELHQLNEPGTIGEYHSDELVGLGSLVCDQCGEIHHYHQPAHITHCIKCHNTHFHRRHFE
jgi:hypothetical protein